MTDDRVTVADVVAGEAQFADLDGDGRAAAHALIDAMISERGDADRFGPAVRAAGAPAVVLDGKSLVEILLDGSRRDLPS